MSKGWAAKAKREDEDQDTATPKHDAIMFWLDQGLRERRLFPQYELEDATWEYPLRNFGANGIHAVPVAYVDLFARFRGPGEDYWAHVPFEVKSDIPSYGALVRQLRKYQTYCPRHWSSFVVVAPFSEVDLTIGWEHNEGIKMIRQQGFHVLNYPGGEFLKAAK